MARGPKTRFFEEAIANGLDSAVDKFPYAFRGDEGDTLGDLRAELGALNEQERKERLQELFNYWQAFDDAHDD